MPEPVVRQIMAALPVRPDAGLRADRGVHDDLPPAVGAREIARGIGTHRAASCGQETFLTTVAVFDEAGSPVPRDRATVGEIVINAARQHARLLAPAGADGRGVPRRRWLDAHGRPRDLGRGGLRLHRRPRQGHGHLGRREHLPGAGRGVHLPPSRRCSSARCSACPTRRGARRSSATSCSSRGCRRRRRRSSSSPAASSRAT